MNHFDLAVYHCLFLLSNLATVHSFINVLLTKESLKNYTGMFFLFLSLFQVLRYPRQILYIYK